MGKTDQPTNRGSTDIFAKSEHSCFE